LQPFDDADVPLHQFLCFRIAACLRIDVEPWVVGIGQDEHPFLFTQEDFDTIDHLGAVLFILLVEQAHHLALGLPWAGDLAAVDVEGRQPGDNGRKSGVLGSEEFEQLDDGSKTTIMRLNEIFWREFVQLESGKLMSSVNPVGGTEKAKAVASARDREGCDWRDVIYVGDSITDKDALTLVRSRGGAAISFNGNRYALQSAQYAVVSHDAFLCAVLAHVFREHGGDGLKSLADGWQAHDVPRNIVPEEERPEVDRMAGRHTIFAKIVPERLPELTEISERVRKTIRGTSIGSLG